MKKIIICYICLTVLSIYSTSVYATSCAYTPLPKEEMKQADVVFKGKLNSNVDHRLEYEVEKVWSGEILVDTVTINDTLLMDQVVGEEYIIFAQSRSGELSPLLCGNTSLATQELESILDQGPMNETTLFAIYLAISVFVVLIGILVFWLRKKMKEVE